MSEAIAQARAEGARLGSACAAVGLTLRTFQRWHGGETLKADARRREHRPEDRVYNPPNRLSQAAYSGPIRPPILIESGHPFWFKPATRSEANRPPILAESGHRFWRKAATNSG